MNKNFAIGLFVLIFLFNQKLIQAQDAMILRAKPDTLWIKVFEIGLYEIKYRNWPVDESMPMMVLPKDKIKRIIYANGTIARFAESDFADERNYEGQNRQAIKFDLLLPTSGSFAVYYEKVLKPGSNIEAGIGAINSSLGLSESTNKGVFFKLGYKFVSQPDYYQSGMRYSHIMKGSYMKPEILFHSFSYTDHGYDYYSYQNQSYTVNKNAVAFLANFGKQWVLGNVFCIDLFCGLGVAVGSAKSDRPIVNVYDDFGYYTPNWGTGFLTGYTGSVSFAGNAGLKIGFLFGTPVERKRDKKSD